MEIAIVGMAGQFPGAAGIEDFWRNLRDGVESLTDLEDEELIARGANPALIAQPQYVKRARVMAGYDRFDAAFFAVSPREAELIDPQQRKFLECAWQALEDAGYDPDRAPRRVGVFAGARMNGYMANVYTNAGIAATVGDLQIQIANDKDYLATRVSYKLDLGGPSVTVQTACSTALVAIHLAGQALLSGECDMALAGGVGVRVPEIGYLYAEGDVNSPDGRVRAFDAGAQGTMFGSGMGVVVLKRLEDALADGDHVRALVKGSAVTNDGSQKVGFTAPGLDGQARVVRAAQLVAEVEPETITYVEAHGTGTPMGDPIEIAALTRAFRESTDRRGFCAVGSVKTNIGHLGAAAGIASVIKTVLALEHKTIPASLHFAAPNPEIDFAASPFYVNATTREWPRGATPRRAGVSAFGMGGTNAHLILEEAPPRPERAAAAGATGSPWQLLLLSARTPEALDRATARLATHLEAHPELAPADVAFTLEEGRKAFEHRRAVVCRDLGDAVTALRALPPERTAAGAVLPAEADGGAAAAGGSPEAAAAGERQLAFLFPGQGAQHAGMGAGLYHGEPVYRAEVDRCAELLAPHLGRDLRPLLDPAPEQAAEAERQLAQTALTQPALFVVEYALARLWMSWGLAPRAMLGHSIGEYVAACLAGVFALPDALALVAARGRLMQDLPGGAMLSVPLPEEEVAGLLGPGLSLAAVNAPARAVVSGPEDAVEALRQRLEAQGQTPRRLHTSHAFHSEMMEPILAPFVRRFAGVELRPPQIPYLSNLTGTWITAAQATDPGYWAQHLRQPVRFAAAVGELWAEPERLLLEVGPGNSLTTLALRHPRRSPRQAAVPSLPHPRDRQDAQPFALRALGQLWAHGAGPVRRATGGVGESADGSPAGAGAEGVDGAPAGAGAAMPGGRRVPLPPYPFAGERYWIEQGDLTSLGGAAGYAGRTAGGKRPSIDDWFYLPSWKPSLPPLPGDEAPAPGSRWLVFRDAAGDGLAGEVLARLARDGEQVVEVLAGDGFARLGERSYAVSPGSREDHDALLKELVGGGFTPEFVLHLWSAARERDADPMAAALEDERRGFWSLLFFAQAWGKQNLKSPLRLAIVSSNLQRVADEEVVHPGKATLLGPARVLPLEYPGLRAASLDCLLPEPGSAAASELAGRLIAEAAAGLPDAVVAWRGGARFVRDYQGVRLAAPPAERLRCKHRGVYLITGGLGGLGLVFAEFLARDHQARLALLGLSPLPPREEWDAWLAEKGPRHRVSEKIRKVRQLEELGAEVLVLAVDVADRAQVADAVGETLARFGGLDGVIHAAGLAGGGVVQLKAPETAARVLAPKVRGTLALDAALAGLPLDFVVLCSSTIAVAGGLGQVDYCAANSFLDAFAHAKAAAGARAGNGVPYTVSINWGAWQEVGMAVATGLVAGPAGETAAVAGGRTGIHPLLDRCLLETAEQTIYETEMSAARHWVLAEHRILGQPALPGTAYVEMARAAFEDHASVFERQSAEAGVEVRDLLFLSPLVVGEGETRTVQLTLEQDGDSSFIFRVTSRARAETGGDGRATAHARGRVGPLAASPAAAETRDLEELRRRCGERLIEVEGPLMSSSESMVFWGPRWQSLRRVWVGRGEGLALIELPAEHAADLEGMAVHPALLDVATGIFGFLEEGTHLPISYQRLALRKPLPRRVYAHLRKRAEEGGGREDGGSRETVAIDVTLMDETGAALVEIERFVMKRLDEGAGSLRRSAGGEAEDGAARAAAPAPALTIGDTPGAGPAGEVPADAPGIGTAATASGTPAQAAAGASGAAAHATGAASAAGSPVALRPMTGEGILSSEGVEVLRRVLVRGREVPQIVASAKDLAALIAQVQDLDRDRLAIRPDLARAPRTSHPRPSLPTPYAAPRDATERQLAEIFQNALGIQEVGIHDNFFDLGGDSMVGIQVVARANEAGLTLSPDQLFEHQTVAQLAALIGGPAAAAGPAAAPPEDSPAAPFADSGLLPEELDKVLAKLKELEQVAGR
jgi:acyl transferase domain-containing protein